MNFNNVYNIEQLKALGALNDIIDALNQAMTPFKVDESVVSYEQLLPYVIRAKRIELYEPDSFFISKKHEYVYYFTQHSNGKERKAKLGCDDRFYSKEYKKEGIAWYRKMSMILQASSVNKPIPNDATAKAQQKLESMKAEFSYEFE